MAGELPAKPIVGFSCPGLGFLDSRGKNVGCLYHPAQNQGKDLRTATGFQEKCARETCPACRAFDQLSPQARDLLVNLCRGMDSFRYSSMSRNPVMRLLAFGPGVAEQAALLVRERKELEEWLWLYEAPPAWGHLLERISEAKSPREFLRKDLTSHMADLVSELRRSIMPLSPLGGGEPIHRLCGEWEARFWREVTGQEKASRSGLTRWREALKRIVSKA